HFGEIERRPDGDIGGISVHVAARVLGLAGAAEILCTRTVKELSLGSGIAFADRGSHVLRGIPDEWQLYAAPGGS
ncbi:MAG: nucleotidyl cyclase domain-containing protein, partial [Acidimicrobiales bacterium]